MTGHPISTLTLSGCTKIPTDSFPIPDALLHDMNAYWPVGGELHRLPTEEAFVNAFAALGSKAGKKPITRAVFATYKGWKQRRLVKVLAEPLPFTYNFPHTNVKSWPLCSSEGDSVATIPWERCQGVQRSSAGSEGVLFVELSNESASPWAVCIKAPAKVAAELYGTRLCQRLGISCPSMYMVSRDSEEGRSIVAALSKFDFKRPQNERHVPKVLKNHPFFLIIEYTPGIELAEQFPPHGDEWSQMVFGDSDQKSISSEVMPTSHVLESLGAIMAFDMFIHNHDRLPCIWDNKGNPGNVMFDASTNEPISIDNMMFCLDPHMKEQGEAPAEIYNA